MNDGLIATEPKKWTLNPNKRDRPVSLKSRIILIYSASAELTLGHTLETCYEIAVRGGVI